MTWRRGVKVGLCAVVAAGLVGCAFSPPQPRKDTRPLQPGAELAEEVGESTKALLKSEGQDRIRYASSLDPETDDTPAPVDPPVKKKPVKKAPVEEKPEDDAPADTPKREGKKEAPPEGAPEDATEGEADAPEAADAP